MEVSGRLTTATYRQPSFADFRIDAFFDRQAGRARIPPSATQQAAGAFEDAVPPSRVSALSDAAGHFMLLFPDEQEIAGRTVKFVVSSPEGRIVRQTEVKTADLARPVTINVTDIGSPAPDEPAPSVTPQSVVVDSLFRSDTALREAITQNLRSRRGDSEVVEARVEKAWRLNPAALSTEALAERHYVAPGADPAPMVETVMMRGVNARRADGGGRTLRLRKSAALTQLMEKASDSSGAGVIGLGPLVDFISSRSTGDSLMTDPAYTVCKAELQADTILATVERNGHASGGNGSPKAEEAKADTRDADALVKDRVHLQMQSVTAPESQLSYGKIPNSSDKDDVQKGLLQTFQLRPGASDVTSYHDFHTLQIAFEHVWTQIFDGQLSSFGRELYREYVKLKDFTGSTDPDLQISTLDDLKRLMDEIKKLGTFVEEDIPSGLRPDGASQKDNNLFPVTPEDAARLGGALATGGASLFIEWAVNELVKLGNNPVKVTWSSFPLALNAGRGNIIELLPPEQNAVYPGNVEIVLETDSNSFKKQIVFQQWDSESQRSIFNGEIQNYGPGHGSERSASGNIIDRLLLNTSQIASGTLKFVSEDEIANHVLLGRYVLGDLAEVLKDRTKVTFRWKGQR
jgi:hypothetical protein